MVVATGWWLSCLLQTLNKYKTTVFQADMLRDITQRQESLAPINGIFYKSKPHNRPSQVGVALLVTAP